MGEEQWMDFYSTQDTCPVQEDRKGIICADWWPLQSRPKNMKKKWVSKRNWKEGKVLGWVGQGVELGGEEMLQLSHRGPSCSYVLPADYVHTLSTPQ